MSGLFSSVGNFWSNIFGGGSSYDDSKLQGLLDQNIANSNTAAGNIRNFQNAYGSANSDLQKRLQEALAQTKANVSGLINQTNDIYDRQGEAQRSRLASQGFTNTSNDVLDRAEASNNAARSQQVANIQNAANQQYFNNQITGISGLNGLNQGAFNNGISAESLIQQLNQNALNAKTGYESNKQQATQASSDMQNQAILKLLGSLASFGFGGL